MKLTQSLHSHSQV